MNQRERMLAIAVGCLAVVLVLWFGWAYVDGQFRTRRQKIAALDGEVAGFRRKVMQSQIATRKLVEYEARSLPPDPELAKSLYQDWLLTEIKTVGFDEPQVKANVSQDNKLFVTHTFGISAKGTLRQVVDLLHAIYSADYLHRIKTLLIKPIENSKQFDITIDIDAVSLNSAPAANALHTQKSQRLALKTKGEYYQAILGRNLFGPPNQPPKLSISGSKDLQINRPASLSATATDPDPQDKVQYRLIASPDPAAKFDEKTGKFSWTPKTLGKYKLVIEAFDDVFPSKPSRQEIALNVVEPKVEEPATGFRGFDQAKFTVLSGVIEVDGEREVWLHNRTKGQRLELRVGDEFEIGSMKGRIESIGLTDFTFLSDGKLHRLEKGSILYDSVEEPQAGETE